MKFSRSTILGLALAVVLPLSQANAQLQYLFGFSALSHSTSLFLNGTTAIEASSRGWYTDAGDNNTSGGDRNYAVGNTGGADIHRNYFVFNLSGFTPTVTSAVLRLENPASGFENPLGPTLSYSVFDVVTGFANLGGASSTTVFNDLGSGAVFGQTTVTSASNNTVIDINLNAAALNSLNTMREQGLWGLGGGLVSTVPEPSTYALMASGLLAVAFASRRRKRSN